MCVVANPDGTLSTTPAPTTDTAVDTTNYAMVEQAEAATAAAAAAAEAATTALVQATNQALQAQAQEANQVTQTQQVATAVVLAAMVCQTGQAHLAVWTAVIAIPAVVQAILMHNMAAPILIQDLVLQTYPMRYKIPNMATIATLAAVKLRLVEAVKLKMMGVRRRRPPRHLPSPALISINKTQEVKSTT